MLAAAVLMSACSIAPMREVLPYADHIRSAISEGDEVVVVTRDGDRSRFTADLLDAVAIHGGDRRIRYADIQRISVRSARPVRNPCDDGTPVGCSVPKALTLGSDRYGGYAARFEDACVVHDYCYRHGLVTYGESRSDCDRAFLQAMRAQCGDSLSLDLESRADCLLAAQEFYLAVRERGEARFRGQAGTSCEYRGPAL